MVDGLRLLGLFASVSIRSQLEYRAAFVVGSLGQFLVTGIEFLAVWALFARFGALEGWTLGEVALFYGVAHVALTLADLLSTGFDHAGELIRMGTLDRLLLRPRSVVLQLVGYELALRRLGRFAQGGLILGWALTRSEVVLSVPGAVLVVLTTLAGACLFYGLFVLQGTLSIWTVESLEMVNATTYGGVAAAQYPLSIYERWFRWCFTFVVPLAFVAYFPLVTALGKPDPLGLPAWVGAVSWVTGPLFLVLALRIWAWGLRHYTSTGS